MRIGALLLTLYLLTAAAQADEPTHADEYRSEAFAYEIQAPRHSWVQWSELENDYPYANYGLLSPDGYGIVIMPLCWEGARPNQSALLEVFLERFGEDYPTPFVQSETDVSKGGATGVYLQGNEPVDDEEYTYHFWIVANDTCAYSFAAWGPADDKATVADLREAWGKFEIAADPEVLNGKGHGS